MRVNDKYIVERADVYNIAIKEGRISTKGATKGQKVYSTIGYYGTWEGAFNTLLEMSIDSNSVRAWQKELRQAKDDIIKAIKENSKEISK